MSEKSNHKEENERLHAKMSTSMGDFTIELYAKECPETVWNFVNLAEGKQETSVKKGNYYDGLIFHRIIKGFMIQGGCPYGQGNGGPGYNFQDEFSPELKHDAPGVLSMANAGPGTNGSQFFITLAPTPHLNGAHTVFGKVIEGIDVIESIGNTPTGPMDKPVEDVVINSVTIERL